MKNMVAHFTGQSCSIRFRWLRLLGFLLALLLLINALYSQPRRHGDGHEYTLITQAIATHGNPSVSVTDVANLIGLVREWPNSGWSIPFLLEHAEAFDAGRNSLGFFRTEAGVYYGYHFWLYPALAAPFDIALRHFEANPLKAMQIVNALVMGTVLIWLLGWQPANTSVRAWTGGCYILGGSLYYLRWTHPEVLVTGMIFLGFASLYVNCWRLALCGFALASLQMLSLAPLLLLVWAYRWQQAYGTPKIRFRMMMKDWPWLFTLFVPLIAPMFYFRHFGRFNMIEDSGFVKPELISIGRLVSTWLDLDQGVIVGLPWLLPLIIFAIGDMFYRKLPKAELAWATLGSLIIIVPLMAQANWNQGHAVFSRYALISAAPLVVWGARYLERTIATRLMQSLVLTIMICWTVHLGGDEAPEDYVHHKPWSYWLLSNYPNIYHPEPEIFAERTLHREVEMGFGGFQDAVAWPHNTDIKKKILVPVAQGMHALDGLCAEEYALVHADGTSVSPNDATHRQHGWGYIDGTMECKPKSRLTF